MRLVDANVLIYAIDVGARHHASAKSWLDAALTGRETVLFPWVSTLAFVRLTTHPRIFEHPLTADQALSVVDQWLAAPAAVIPEPDSRHVHRLRELLETTGARGGNLVNDAHLAALSVEYGAVVVTYDSDFGRFPGVRWETPPSP